MAKKRTTQVLNIRKSDVVFIGYFSVPKCRSTEFSKRGICSEEKKRFLGSFSSDGDDSVRLEFLIHRNGMLSVKRQPTGVARNLHFLGERSFAPQGAEAVRIRLNEALSQCTGADGPLNILFSRVS